MRAIRSHLSALVAISVAMVVCFVVLVTAGVVAARWSVGVGLLISALVVVSGVRSSPPKLVPIYPSGRESVRRGYPGYEHLSRMVSLSMEERRYCDRVLVPWLHRMAVDRHAGLNPEPAATQDWLKARLRPDSWRLLDVDAPLASGSPADPPAPDDRVLAALIDDLESLET